MAAGGFSRIYAGIGGNQIDLYFEKQVLRFLSLAQTGLYFIKEVFNHDRNVCYPGPAAVGSAPNAALFFCTYDTIKKQAIRK